MAALARAGKVDKRGYPKNPLQLTASLRTLSHYGGYENRLPIGLQNLVSATLGRLAEALGYHGARLRSGGAS